MFKDPIVEEVREIRREIEREVGSSSEAYAAHLREIQQQWRDRLVRREPQRLVPLPTAS